MTHERDIALMEANRIAATDAYFEARPNIDMTEVRRIFEAGFQRGWDAKPVTMVYGGGGGAGYEWDGSTSGGGGKIRQAGGGGIV